MIICRIPHGKRGAYGWDMTPFSLRIGIFGIGLDTYWPQFPGLKDRLEGYVERLARKIARPGVDIVNAGLVDNADRAHAVGRQFRREDVDVIFLYVTTYALSSTVLPVIRRANVPVIVLNLAPEPAIDYVRVNALGDRTRMTGEWLAYCPACPVPEIANVLQRSGVSFHQVTGVLENDPACWQEIDDWIEAARVMAGMNGNRLGSWAIITAA
jgi:L-arabinose isomerase